MSWMGTGYDGIENAWDNLPGRSGGGPRRVWLKPGTTNRFMFMDDDPTTFWEHQFKYNGDWKNWEPCVVRNKIGPQCPPCDSDEKAYPYYVGLHTAINMTPWFTKKTNQEVNFVREIYAAKLGGDKKPGVLKKLKKLKEKHGRLRGLVFDVERPGEKTESCGSDFDLVENIEPGEIRTYAMDQLSAYVARINENAPQDKQTTVEKLWERNPWEAYNFEEIIKPRSIDELRGMFSGASGGSSGSSSDDDSKADDDLPY